MVRIGNPGGNQYGGPPPHQQQPYGQPGMYQQPYYGAPPEPPRRSRLKPILGWLGVIVGGVVATVAGSFIVDKVNEKNDKPDKPVQAVSEQGIPFPEGYTPPPAKAFTDGPNFRATGDKNTWPDACAMLTDAEIQNAIPNAQIVGSREGRPPSARKKDSCAVNLTLPNLQSPANLAKVNVAIKAIGDEGPVKGAFEKAKADATSHPNFEDLSNKLLVDSAFRDNATLFLLEKGYFVSVEVLGDIKDSAGQNLPREAWTKQVGPALVQILNIRMSDQ